MKIWKRHLKTHFIYKWQFAFLLNRWALRSGELSKKIVLLAVLLGMFLLVFPVEVSPVTCHCVTAHSALCYDSLIPRDVYLKFNLLKKIYIKTKLAVTFENSYVSTDGHSWLGPIFPTRFTSSCLEFLLELKTKKEVHQPGLAAVLAKPQTSKSNRVHKLKLPPKTWL